MSRFISILLNETSLLNRYENLGPAGLTALKNLRDEGFNVVAFERRDRIGGVWSFSHNRDFTTVLDEMVSNVSKFVVSSSAILCIRKC